MARKVRSKRTMNGGMPSFLAVVVRHALRACSSCWLSGESSIEGAAELVVEPLGADSLTEDGFLDGRLPVRDALADGALSGICKSRAMAASGSSPLERRQTRRKRMVSPSLIHSASSTETSTALARAAR